MAGSYDFEEQERIAELKAWWEDNRLYVLGAVIVAFVAFAGYRGWVHWNASQSEEAAALYKPVAEAAKAKDAKKIPAAAQAVIAKYPRSYYASEAALVIAEDHCETRAARVRLLHLRLEAAALPHHYREAAVA